MKTIRIKIVDGEFQVPGITDREEEIYFTNDLQDALGTAQFIHGTETLIKFKREE